MDNINNTPNDLNEEKVETVENLQEEAVAESAPANNFENNDTMPAKESETVYTYQQGATEINSNLDLDDSKAKAKSRLSMILGIISVASVCLCCCFPVALVLGIISLVSAFKSKKLSPTGKLDGMAVAGIICSIFGIVFSFFVLVYIGFVAFAYLLDPELFEATFEEAMYEAGYTF